MTSAHVPTPREGVKDHSADTAEEFLDTLSPRNDLWSADPPSWIYRGQADAEWELKAKAERRPDEFEKYGIRIASASRDDVDRKKHWMSDRKHLQDQLLERFRNGLDRSGLSIPSRSPEVISSEQVSYCAEPRREAFPLMALAQHHGLPTMLLDWTRRAWVAAYFAAVEFALGNAESATHLAVWALQRGNRKEWLEGLRFYDAPGGTNPNLKAQAGLFTSHLADGDPSLEQYLAKMRQTAKGVPVLRRIAMPTQEARKLLRLLSYEEISAASMFPGADGVVKAMYETTLWDSCPP